MRSARLLSLLALPLALGAGPAPPAELARAEARALSARLVEAAGRRATADAEADAAARRLDALSVARRLHAESAARDRAALERALMDLALADRAGRRGPRVSIQAATASALVARLEDAAADAAALDRLRRRLEEDRARLLAAKSTIDRERTAMQALLADRASAVRAGAASAARMAPVKGRVVRAFGAKTAAGDSLGMTWRARAGDPVFAPADAVVSFAGPFRGLGEVLILDLGGADAVILMGVEALTVETGRKVLAGEPIGEVRFTEKAQPNRPRAAAAGVGTVYMEVRRDGRAIDPTVWLATGRPAGRTGKLAAR